MENDQRSDDSIKIKKKRRKFEAIKVLCQSTLDTSDNVLTEKPTRWIVEGEDADCQFDTRQSFKYKSKIHQRAIISDDTTKKEKKKKTQMERTN